MPVRYTFWYRNRRNTYTSTGSHIHCGPKIAYMERFWEFFYFCTWRWTAEEDGLNPTPRLKHCFTFELNNCCKAVQLHIQISQGNSASDSKWVSFFAVFLRSSTLNVTIKDFLNWSTFVGKEKENILERASQKFSPCS